jgi:uncharacterized membrane protein YdbT with pleckstrin-like domain
MNNNPQRSIKPNAAAGTAIRGGVVLVGTAVLTGVLIWSSSIPSVIVLIGGLMLGLAAAGTVLFNLRSREYRFYNNEIEVYEGFINIKRNNTSYDRVTDISYSQPVTQRLFGTGTVKLNTAGSGRHEIKISYVNEPQKEYDRLKNIVDGEAQT